MTFFEIEDEIESVRDEVPAEDGVDFGGARLPGNGGRNRTCGHPGKRTKREGRPGGWRTHRLLRMRRSAGGLFLGAGLLFAGSPAVAADDDAPLIVEVRVFEVRRLNSDFSPIEDLSFLVNTDGSSVQVSEWLATLARRIPDAYFAQLLTLGPAPAESEAELEQSRGGTGGEPSECDSGLWLEKSPSAGEQADPRETARPESRFRLGLRPAPRRRPPPRRSACRDPSNPG